MPYINVKITREGVTREQKRRIIGEMTQVLTEVLGKDPRTTFVVIDEVELDDWGIGGLPVPEFRKSGTAKLVL
jgi:4-oxalocrotonate tautomerase